MKPELRWKPHVTVAAVIEQAGRFLLVEETVETQDSCDEKTKGLFWNQPAGHLESQESLEAAVVREVLEETATHFVPQALVGIYLWHDVAKTAAYTAAYLRFAFAGDYLGEAEGRSLDTGIVGVHWLSLQEIRAVQSRHRSPLVLRCVEDWLAGRRYPLSLLQSVLQPVSW